MSKADVEVMDGVQQPHWSAAGDFTQADDPFQLFAAWYEDARGAEPSDPNAMTLATGDATGMPNARMVLLKDVSNRGFVFYTHATSAKGCELGADKGPMPWKNSEKRSTI